MKHILSFKNTLALTVLMAMIGCHTSNTSLIAPIKDPKLMETPSGKFTEAKFNPRTDILFIVDNSLSMLGHQEKLKQNINMFVDELGKDSIVDFHIGVTTIFDSKRYGPFIPKVCEATKEVLWEDNGTLLKPKAPQGKEDLASKQPSNYIQKADGFMDVLKETLKVGVVAYKQGDKCPERGPVYEEYFSTITSTIELAQNGGPNSQFYRGSDAHLVVFILSDTGDSSPLQAADVYNKLRELRADPEGKTFTIHAVTDPGGLCSQEYDKSGPLEKTVQLTKLSNGQIISLCDPQYGATLAKLGTELRKKVTENMTIRLPAIPEEGALKGGKTLILSLGGEELKPDTWSYNTSTKTIQLKDGVPWSKYPGQSVKVDYIPVNVASKYSVKIN